MGSRRIVVERPVTGVKRSPSHVSVEVSDDMLIGSLVSTLAARFGYPLSDSFGLPVTYRLRPLAGGASLQNTARFVDARVRSGSRFVLESEAANNDTLPIPEERVGRRILRKSHQTYSRRTILVTGSALLTTSILGLATGMTAAVAQNYVSRRAVPASVAGATTTSGTLGLSIATEFTSHRQPVQSVTWSPDGTMVASGGDDDLALIWKTDGTILQTLQVDDHIRALAWSPDGTQLVLGSGNAVSFFDPYTGLLFARNRSLHTAAVTALVWSQAGQAISASDDKRAIVWNGQTHQSFLTFRRHTTAILALALLSDTVATVSQGGVVRIWNILNGQEMHGYFFDTAQALRAAAFAPGGLLAVGGNDGIVCLWKNSPLCTQEMQDTFGMRCVDVPQHLQGHSQTVHAVAFSPDGTLLATGGDDGKMIIWSIQDMRPIITQQVQAPLASLAWSASGQFLAVAAGLRVTIWQIHH